MQPSDEAVYAGARARQPTSPGGIGAAYLGRAAVDPSLDAWRGMTVVDDGEHAIEILVTLSGIDPTWPFIDGERVAAIVEQLAVAVPRDAEDRLGALCGLHAGPGLDLRAFGPEAEEIVVAPPTA